MHEFTARSIWGLVLFFHLPGLPELYCTLTFPLADVVGVKVTLHLELLVKSIRLRVHVSLGEKVPAVPAPVY